MDSETLSLAAILTAGGATATAGFIKGLVSLVKTLPKVGDWMKANALEPAFAFVLSAVAVIAAAISAVQAEPDIAGLPFYFTCFIAWYGVARLSMAIHDDIAQNPNSLTGPRIGNLKADENNTPPARDEGLTGPA